MPHAEEYLIEQADAESFENARMYTTIATEQTIARREPGTLHFRVCAVNAGGEGPWSNAEQVSVAPPPPEWVEAARAQADGPITVSWAAVGSRATYCVEQAAEEDGPFERLYEGPATQVETAAPDGAAAVRYRVRAELPGVASGWRTSQPLRLSDRPAAPHVEPPEVDETGTLRLRWAEVDGIAKYFVEVSKAADFAATQTSEVSGTMVNYRPPASGRYHFRVRALGEANDETVQGTPAEPVSAVVRGPAAPQLHALDPVKPGAAFTVEWSGLPGTAHYELEEALTAEFKPGETRALRVKHPAQKAAIEEGRPAGQRVFRVKCVNTAGEASPWSKPLTVEVKP